MALFDIRETGNGSLEILVEETGAGEQRWEPYAEHWLRHRRVESPLGGHLPITWLEELEREGWAHPRNFMEPPTQLLPLPEPPTLDYWDDAGLDDIDEVGAAILALAAIGALFLAFIIGIGLVEFLQRIL